jgi:hypothetical protein
MDIRPQGVTLIERFKNPPIEVPIDGAQIQLRHATNDAVYSGASDGLGAFELAGVPDGVYVMQVRGGVNQDSSNFLVQVTPTAAKDSLQIIRGDLCGGTVIQLRP